MNYKIPENTRHSVIRLWLEGKSRKDIAVTCGLGEGTVSNIVSDWRRNLSYGDAEALRELGSNLKRTGIDAAQCAQGFKISIIIRKMGINKEAFESFISKVYERCQKVDGGGLTPDKIGSYLEDLLEFSQDDDNNNGNNTIKLSEISHYIEQMKNEKRTLKQDIQNLQQQKKVSQQEASWSKELHDAALEDEKTTVAEIREYSNFKTELEKHGLSIEDDARKFVQVIHGIKQHGYDVDKVLSEYLDQEIKQIKRDLLINEVKGLEDTKTRLLSECSSLESQVNLHSQRLYIYDELKSMGFGLGELKIILNTIKEIAAEENVIDYRLAVDKFFESLEQRYDIKLRQKVLKEQQQLLQKYNNTTKSDNPNRTFPVYRNNESSNVLSKPSTLVDKQRERQREMPSSSMSYTYRKITTSSKREEEEQNKELNPYQDEWDGSDYDQFPSSSS
jgi:hypothetical protein